MMESRPSASRGTYQVTQPSGKRLPNRPARPPICLICATVSGRTEWPSDFFNAEKTIRRMFLAAGVGFQRAVGGLGSRRSPPLCTATLK